MYTKKDILNMSANMFDIMFDYVESLNKEVEQLQQENKQLIDNWNRLKEYLHQDINNRNGNKVVEIESGNRIAETISPIYIEMIDKSKAMKEIIDKMQELEKVEEQ